MSGRRGGGRVTSKGGQKRFKSRPEWDSTQSDLSVHKLTLGEMGRRHQMHISKNVEAARNDLYEKPKITSPLMDLTRQTVLNSSNKSLTKKSLQDLLTKTDQSLAVVHDMFGDDPKRYSVQPSVTVAPHIISNKENIERALQESSIGGEKPTAIMSPGGIRHDGIISILPPKPAINELILSDDGSQDVGDSSYLSSIDFDRFHSFIHKEDITSVQTTPTNSNQSLPKTIEHLQHEIKSCGIEMGEDNETPSIQADINSFSGLTSFLVHSMTSLTNYIKQCQREIKEAHEIRNDMLQTINEQQSVIDILAKDIVKLTTKTNDVQSVMENLTKTFHHKMRQLENELRNRTVPFHPMFLPPPYLPLMTSTPTISSTTPPIPHSSTSNEQCVSIQHPLSITTTSTTIPHPLGTLTTTPTIPVSHPLGTMTTTPSYPSVRMTTTPTVNCRPPNNNDSGMPLKSVSFAPLPIMNNSTMSDLEIIDYLSTSESIIND